MHILVELVELVSDWFKILKKLKFLLVCVFTYLEPYLDTVGPKIVWYDHKDIKYLNITKTSISKVVS